MTNLIDANFASFQKTRRQDGADWVYAYSARIEKGNGRMYRLRLNGKKIFSPNLRYLEKQLYNSIMADAS